jgi:hypothetical protein
MGGARRLLLLTIVGSATACILTQPLDGLTGGGGDGGATGDVTTDTNVKDEGGGGDGPSTEGAVADASDAHTAVDASDAGSPADVTQPDVAHGTGECADAGVLLCEDFENGLNTTKWPVTTMQLATAVVDGTQHHRGAYALHVNVPALTTDGSAVNVAADIRHYTTVPSPVFIRAYVMFSSAQPQSTEQFFLAQQSQSPYDGLQLELDQQTGTYSVTDWSVSPTFYANSTVAAAATTWNCIEWELDPPASGTTKTNSDVWVGGTEVSSLHLTNTPMTDLEVLGFGIGFYQVTTLPAYDLWIDDIYVDTSRVGCTK